jgi:GMP synthase (glutamine-hydrolysing)
VSCLTPLFAPGVSVLHWHGDTFELPAGAVHLASSTQYAHQAFAHGDHGWAFQCHPEVRGADLERWFIGHACELGQAGVDITALRAESQKLVPALERAAATLWSEWLAARFG